MYLPESDSKIMIADYRSMDMVTSDFNGDLILDVFFTNKGVSWQGKTMEEVSRKDLLLINSGEQLVDQTGFSGMLNPTSCHSIGTGDFDNDMDVDIYLVCTLNEENIPNILYENLGNGTFQKIPRAGGAEGSLRGMGDSVAIADYDNDGFLDMFITNGLGQKPVRFQGPSQLFHNLGNENNWIQIDLKGTLSNHDAIGSTIFVTAGNVTQIREQNGGMHNHAQNFQRIHFGLKNSTMIDKIIVFWPSGLLSEINNIKSNEIIKIVEPSKPLTPNHQFKLGVKSYDVICNEFLELIIKNKDGKPSCVKSSSIQILLDRGWGHMPKPLLN